MKRTIKLSERLQKMAGKRYADVDGNDNERIVNSTIPRTSKRRHKFGLSVFNGE